MCHLIIIYHISLVVPMKRCIKTHLVIIQPNIPHTTCDHVRWRAFSTAQSDDRVKSFYIAKLQVIVVLNSKLPNGVQSVRTHKRETRGSAIACYDEMRIAIPQLQPGDPQGVTEGHL